MYCTSRTADAIFLFFICVQRLDIKMSALTVNLVEYGESFGCFSVTFSSEVFGKEVTYGFPDVVFSHFYL